MFCWICKKHGCIVRHEREPVSTWDVNTTRVWSFDSSWGICPENATEEDCSGEWELFIRLE